MPIVLTSGQAQKKIDGLPPFRTATAADVAKSTLSLERIEDIRLNENVLKADELRGFDLEAKVDGKATPLEKCLVEFNDLAIGDDSDCHVSGVYEMGLSVCALLEAGAVQTPRVKALLKDLSARLAMHEVVGTYYCLLGAANEVRDVLTCAEKMAMGNKKRANAASPETETKGKKGKSK